MSQAVTQFLAMGGYAAYVWSAFGIAALALLVLFAQSWLAARSREAEFAELRRQVRGAEAAPRPVLRPTRTAKPDATAQTTASDPR